MKNKEYKVGDGMFVAFAYTLTDAKSGEKLFEVSPDRPDCMVYGVTQEIVPGLIAAMKDLKSGDKFSVELPPEAAFGKRYDENVMKLDKEIFMQDGKLADEVKIDAQLPMMTQEGYRVLGRVLDIDDSHVTMDFNHPFADKSVKYDGEVVMVRPATEEELNPQQGCCGCHGGSCGDGCGDGEGDGCCGSGKGKEGGCCGGGCD